MTGKFCSSGREVLGKQASFTAHLCKTSGSGRRRNSDKSRCQVAGAPFGRWFLKHEGKPLK